MKQLCDKQLLSIINKNKILGFYDSNQSSKDLLIISSILEINYYAENIDLYYITNENIADYSKKFLSLFYKKDQDFFKKEEKNISLFRKIQKKYLYKIKFIEIQDQTLNLTLLSKNIDKNRKSILFIRNIDKATESSFHKDGHKFLNNIKRSLDSKVIYDFSFAMLTKFKEETDELYALGEKRSELLLENVRNRERFFIPKESSFLSLPNKYKTDNLFNCTCGGLKTYGKIAERSYLYHSYNCDIII